jgi:ABC-2 type transport system permease protein
MESHLQSVIRVRNLTELGIDPQLVAQANVDVIAKPLKLFTKRDDGSIAGNDESESMVSMFLPFGIMMLMFVVIFMAAQPMLESGMEEKSARIAELLLGSVSPKQLLAGKLFGNVAGSFVIFAVYGIGGWIVMQRNHWDLDLPWTLMPWVILFQILGVLFFSSIFLMIGASVSELKEAQSLLLPVWLVMMLPMMVWFTAVRDPNGIVPVALSFFPPSAPLMISLRLATGQSMPMWHAPLAALVMLMATSGVVMLAARIYRASLLKSDSAASIALLFKRFRSAD